MILVAYATGKLRFKTANPAGVPYDPTDFTVIVKDPGDLVGAGQTYTYVETPPPASTIERVALGEFLVRIDATSLKPGRWRWRARGVDPGDANRVDVSEGSFKVESSGVVTNAT